MVNVGDEAWHEDEVCRAVTNDLISDVQVTASRISGLRYHGQRPPVRVNGYSEGRFGQDAGLPEHNTSCSKAKVARRAPPRDGYLRPASR
jgi:hypothetical protein